MSGANRNSGGKTPASSQSQSSKKPSKILLPRSYLGFTSGLERPSSSETKAKAKPETKEEYVPYYSPPDIAALVSVVLVNDDPLDPRRPLANNAGRAWILNNQLAQFRAIGGLIFNPATMKQFVLDIVRCSQLTRVKLLEQWKVMLKQLIRPTLPYGFDYTNDKNVRGLSAQVDMAVTTLRDFLMDHVAKVMLKEYPKDSEFSKKIKYHVAYLISLCTSILTLSLNAFSYDLQNSEEVAGFLDIYFDEETDTPMIAVVDVYNPLSSIELAPKFDITECARVPLTITTQLRLERKPVNIAQRREADAAWKSIMENFFPITVAAVNFAAPPPVIAVYNAAAEDPAAADPLNRETKAAQNNFSEVGSQADPAPGSF